MLTPKQIKLFYRLSLAFLLLTSRSQISTGQQSLPSPYGDDAHWMSAAKNGFGTSNSLASKVWFTLTEGVLSEVFYPTVDVPNVQCLQLIVVTPDGKVETELENTNHKTSPANDGSLSFSQFNVAKSGAYVISKNYITDPQRNTLLVRIYFVALRTSKTPYQLFVYYDPSLANSGMHDSGWSEGTVLVANDKDKSSALMSRPAFVKTANGYLNRNDGLTQLRANHAFITGTRVTDGNLVQVAQLPLSRSTSSRGEAFVLALGFGNDVSEAKASARLSLTRKFDSVSRDFQRGWTSYTTHLPTTTSKYQRQFNMKSFIPGRLIIKLRLAENIQGADQP